MHGLGYIHLNFFLIWWALWCRGQIKIFLYQEKNKPKVEMHENEAAL